MLFLSLPKAWLPFSFDFAGLDALDNLVADLPFNSPAGLPLPRPCLLVVPLSDAEVFDLPVSSDN